MNYSGPYPPPPFYGHFPFHSPNGPTYVHHPSGPYGPFPGSPTTDFSAHQGAFHQHPHSQWQGHIGSHITYQQGPDGWYYPVPSITPRASPNQQVTAPQPLALPTPSVEVPPQLTPPDTPPQSKQDLPKIDDYWKGRIVAPLSGPSTPRRFVTLATNRSVAITKPDEQKDAKPKLKLLPPRSYPPLPNPDSDRVSL